MINTLSYDLVIMGSDIAGLRTAFEATREASEIRIAVLTKVQAMRSHSVCAGVNISQKLAVKPVQNELIPHWDYSS